MVAAVRDVHLTERFGDGDLLELLVAGARLPGVERAGGADRRQGDGQVLDAVVAGRSDRWGAAEAGRGR